VAVLRDWEGNRRPGPAVRHTNSVVGLYPHTRSVAEMSIPPTFL